MRTAAASSWRCWGSAQHAGEDVLGDGAAGRTIPARDLAVHDGRSQRLLGAPVGRIDRGVKEKAQQRRQLGAEMGSKALHGGKRAGVVQHGEELAEYVAPGHGGPVRRDGPSGTPVADAERLLQERLDACGERGARMIAHQVATASQEMGHARLMSRRRELAVGRPAIADQHAVVVGAEDRRRRRESAPGLNPVDRRLGRGEGPQPVELPVDFPARFIGGDDGTPRMTVQRAA